MQGASSGRPLSFPVGADAVALVWWLDVRALGYDNPLSAHRAMHVNPAQPPRYIAVEMAGIFDGLGTETTLMCRGETVLRRGFDQFIVETLMAELKAHGPELVNNASPTELVKEADGTLTLKLKDGRSFGGYDCVLSAIGRDPKVDTLNLDKTSVKLDRGYIVVDEYESTAAKGIYAIGDATTSGCDSHSPAYSPSPDCHTASTSSWSLNAHALLCGWDDLGVIAGFR